MKGLIMFRYLMVALAALFFAIPAYAGGGHHHNNATKAAAAATGGAGGAAMATSGDNTYLSTGAAGGLSTGWTGAVSFSFSTVFFGWSWTDDSEICRLAFQKREVCADSPDSKRCAELKAEIANWAPPMADVAEPSAAAE